MTATLDMGRFTDNGRVHNLSGKPKGEDARAALNLDSLDREEGEVLVDIPPDLYAISPSFFLGLFSASLRFFHTRERFLQHYRFNAEEFMLSQVDEAINRHFTKNTALDV